MRIESIKQDGQIFTVEFKPSWIEKVFGAKAHIKRYKTNYEQYRSGGGFVYINEDGLRLGNRHWIGEALDAFQRKF